MPLQTFPRANTFPDLGSLYPAIVAAIGNQFVLICDFRDNGSKPVIIDKGTAWSPAQIAAVQAAVTNAPASTAPVIPIDAFPLVLKAVCLALVDQLNVIRAALPTPLAAITPAQALTSIRNKAGTL